MKNSSTVYKHNTYCVKKVKKIDTSTICTLQAQQEQSIIVQRRPLDIKVPNSHNSHKSISEQVLPFCKYATFSAILQ